MFGYEDYSKEQFKGTLTSFGHPVSVLQDGKLGATLPSVEPTVFSFYGSRGTYMITVGNITRGEYVGLTSEGYLHVVNAAVKFTIKDLQGISLLQHQDVGGQVVVHMRAREVEPVILFDGNDAFDDLDTLHNCLIAGRKIRHETENKGVFYTVPTGQGSWEKCPADQQYAATPTPLILNIL
ncbi:hypothetical protein C2E19_10125 [Pseudomonas sp. DTU12.3]|uniref:hypothetical protein n=1 Tax=Pseudomonas sp. DTU12.3 TaxID=2073078 RepID=UPI001012E4F0|nr:hypothetical protein [Pseudomonas sp. DTU12.3]QAX84198.1 hypothetical protein C2E19_10125 [Pseudomonas sp. DTU12.3]